MFKIITPHGHNFHQLAIRSFLDLLKVYQNFKLNSCRKMKSTFIIAEENKRGIYGGAVLYPQKVNNPIEPASYDRYEDSFREAFATFQPDVHEFWTARICFCLEITPSSKNLEEINLCGNFYRNLYEAFLAFGLSKEIDFLAFSLYSFERLKPPLYKKWPHCMPVQFSHTSDGLYHGILSFSGKKFIPNKKMKPDLEDSANQNISETVHQGRAS